MDSELFTIGGMNATMHPNDFKDKTASTDNLNYQWVKTLQAYRHVGKVLFWYLILALAYLIVILIPSSIYVWGMMSKAKFTQKEGLQYLGASTNVTRDDMGWPTKDSLAESALQAQSMYTDMHPAAAAAAVAAKATFISPREHMASTKNVETPEEKLLKQQQGRH